MNLREILAYYSRDDIQNALLESGKDREVVGVFKNEKFGSRPNTLVHPQDILAMVRTGIVEFHCSLERWSNPMALKLDNYESLRKGWDLIFDIDCKDFEHGKIGAKAVIWGLKKHDVKNFSIKFTGGTGFHIGIPWGSIPKEVDYKPAVELFPDLPRKVGLYLQDFVKERLSKAFLKKFSPEELAKMVNKPLGKVLAADGIDPFQIVQIDPILISPRHLIRMPYSLNKKTFLVSLPLKPRELNEFKMEMASPEKIKAGLSFLKDSEPREAELLIGEALDWFSKRQKERIKKPARDWPKSSVPEEFFPPCIKTILKGLSDGRKRSVFILLNFLRSLKWKWENIENLMTKWNQRNKGPLRESYVVSQIRYQKRREKAVLPPNCSNEAYYKAFGICKPDSLCTGLKNPVNYPFRKMKLGQKK